MIRTAPRGPYQAEAVERALAFDGFLVFAEQRTGKCWISLSVVDARKPKNLWIICPKSAIRVWKEQIAEHLKIDWKFNLVMMNYEELIARKKFYYKQARVPDLMIIADEIHRAKRRGTSTSSALRTLSRRARWRLGLTGTPIGNGIQDAWAQFNFVDPELFGPYSDVFDKKTGQRLVQGFDSRYLVHSGKKFGKQHTGKVIGYHNEEEFREKFRSRSYRIKLRDARKKKLITRARKEWMELSEHTRDIYDELEAELVVEVNKKKVQVPVIIALIMKLQQLTGGFIITEEGPEIVGNEKLRKLIRIVRRLKAAEKKVVIVSRFLFEIDRICARLRSRDITCKIVSGDNPFDGKFEEDCVVIQIQSGVAVDMAAADDLIFYSCDYSYLNHEQMRFRILNYDKPSASFHYLLIRGTIDEQIYEAQTRKKNLAHVVLDKYRRKK